MATQAFKYIDLYISLFKGTEWVTNFFLLFLWSMSKMSVDVVYIAVVAELSDQRGTKWCLHVTSAKYYISLYVTWQEYI